MTLGMRAGLRCHPAGVRVARECRDRSRLIAIPCIGRRESDARDRGTESDPDTRALRALLRDDSSGRLAEQRRQTVAVGAAEAELRAVAEDDDELAVRLRAQLADA